MRNIGFGINYPFDARELLCKKKAIRRQLLGQGNDFFEKRIAIIGGSTTAEVKDMLELFLLQDGIRPVFYESEYNRYYEDLMFENPELDKFSPELIYIHTTSANITRFPSVHDASADVERLLLEQIKKFEALWGRAHEKYKCPVIQNNFEMPHYRMLGNLDAYELRGRTRFTEELNRGFAEKARESKGVYLNDIHYLSAWFGLERWYDKFFWYSYKYAMSYEAIPFLADSVASIVKAIYGKSRKGLILDLDNTLWGGVIGEDGLGGIKIGRETAEAEAYTEFQQYIKTLKERGILLAVCSKNDDVNAREGFVHPDSVLSLEDFSAFRANWDPKHENIKDIASSLNVGIDSFVFLDDNPAEREIIRAQVPQVAVPDFGGNVAKYIDILDKTGYFETVSLSAEDLQRSSIYAGNSARQSHESRFENYEDFLRSLEMKAEIRPFEPAYLERITQLINKTNQFNVTTRRYSAAEVQVVAESKKHIHLYGRLKDRFGDNGLISVVIGEIRDAELHLDLWLMSCRVLKRGMEAAMMDELVARARARGIRIIHGYYFPTAKNAMVSELFGQLGFIRIKQEETGASQWRFEVPANYRNTNQIMEVCR